MLHPSTKRLIDKLSEMTRKQRVAWTEGENGTVVHDTEGYRVVITPEPHSVLLTDALGREVWRTDYEGLAGRNIVEWRPEPGLPSGWYFATLRSAKGVRTAKVEVVR